MKAKRLTALALAALMTASGTSVAFAKESTKSNYDLDFVSSSGDYYYGYDEDENAIIKKKPSEFQPGDTIYIPLLEDSDEKFNNSRGKNFTVYIDGNKFDIGDKYVDDVGVVYKKGIYTVPGTTITTYTLNLAGTALGAFHNKTIDGATSKEDALTKGIALINQGKADLINQKTDSYKRTVYVFDDVVYVNQKDAVEAAASEGTAGLKKVNSYYIIDGTEKEAIPTEWKKDENGYAYTSDGGVTAYAATLPVALNQIGYTEYTQANFPDVEYYYQATEEPAKYGDVTKDVTEGKKIEYSKEGAQIWINSKTNKYITGNIEEENIGVATSNTIAKISANEYYDTSNVVHTVVTVNEPAYFNPDGTFYSKVADIPATNADVVTECPGYVVDAVAYLDDTVARQEATKEIDDRISGMNVNDNIIEHSSTSASTTVRDWGYWAYIDTKKSTTTKDIDIVGKIYVGTSKSDAEDETGFYVDVTLTNKDVGNSTFVDVDSDAYIEPGQRAVLSFADDADDVVIEFGDDAWYEFNARGQGRVNFAYNTNFDRDFAYDYDHANIDFINFVAEPTTNKTGTLYIYADEDSYIYEVTSKGAKKINGAYYDDDEGAWVIRTRHLTSYAISDRRLKTIDQMEDDKNSSSSSKPSGSQGSGSGNGNYKPIPDTGR